jgi:hypothetical protein
MPESPHVFVNDVELRGVDLSHGLSVSNVAGHVVVNGHEVPALDTAHGFAPGAMANITITDADIGAANASNVRIGGLAASGTLITGLDTTGGPVLVNTANTGSNNASSSVVLEPGSAMAFDWHDLPAVTNHFASALDQHPDFDIHPVVGHDWLFG